MCEAQSWLLVRVKEKDCIYFYFLFYSADTSKKLKRITLTNA